MVLCSLRISPPPGQAWDSNLENDSPQGGPDPALPADLPAALERVQVRPAAELPGSPQIHEKE